MKEKTPFGKTLKLLLKAKGARYQDLANYLNISRQQVGNMIKSDTPQKAERFERLAKFLQCDVNDLYQAADKLPPDVQEWCEKNQDLVLVLKTKAENSRIVRE